MKKRIDKMSSHELISHFKDAVCDRHYNPSNEDYNQSSYSFDELEGEIFRRLNQHEDDCDMSNEI